jgi:hypothetical protein
MKTLIKHRWKCSDTPGYFICFCGATGAWNRALQKVEVEHPVPWSVYLRRHVAPKDTK